MGNLGQALLIPGKGGLRRVAFDDFTDANTTALESHAASDGGTWTHHGNSGLGSVAIDGNRAHNPNTSTTHFYYHSWAPAAPDYDVQCDVVMRSDNNAGNAGPAGRIATGADTLYAVRYVLSSDVWQLIKRVAGAQTQLGGSIAQTLVVDQAYRVVLSMRGSALNVFVDGVPIITTTDSAIPGPGRAGIYTGNAATASVGIHLDNWQAVQRA